MAKMDIKCGRQPTVGEIVGGTLLYPFYVGAYLLHEIVHFPQKWENWRHERYLNSLDYRDVPNEKYKDFIFVCSEKAPNGMEKALLMRNNRTMKWEYVLSRGENKWESVCKDDEMKKYLLGGHPTLHEPDPAKK